MVLLKKSIRFAVISVIFYTTSCCCPHPPANQPLPCAVAVREHQLRFDAGLPLQIKDMESLVQFLVAGGDRNVMGEDAVLLGADAHYRPLLQLLAQTENLYVDSLSKSKFSKWFTQKPTFQVVDAREENVPVPGAVFAYPDASFWWIFHQKEGKLIQLIVIKSNPSNN